MRHRLATMRAASAADVDRSLESSVKDVSAYGQMLGFGEAYFGAYAVWLGVSNSFVGLLGSLPPFAGACLQPLAAGVMARTGRRRLLYLVGATLQAMTFVPICVSTFLPRETAYPVLLTSVILYFAGVHFATPSWNSVMGDLVPSHRRGRFFGRRASVMVISQCLATLAAGVGLQVYKRAGHEAWGFALIFAAALAARATSVWHLSQMTAPMRDSSRDTAMVRFARGGGASNFRRFVLFVAAMNFSVAVSGPYFVPYMLNELHFTYTHFMVSQLVVVLAQILVLQRWGALADHAGNRRILIVTAAGVMVIPLIWIFIRHPAMVWTVQAFAGMTWGGFNLSAGNFVLDSLPREERARGVARFNFAVGVGIVLGGLFGVAIVDRLPRAYAMLGLTITFDSHLHVIMLISALFRLATFTVFLRRFREVRDVPSVGVAEVLLRSTAVKSIAEAAGDFLTWYRRDKDSGRDRDEP